jgi:chromosomal replication initiation ATPase DnaA
MQPSWKNFILFRLRWIRLSFRWQGQPFLTLVGNNTKSVTSLDKIFDKKQFLKLLSFFLRKFIEKNVRLYTENKFEKNEFKKNYLRNLPHSGLNRSPRLVRDLNVRIQPVTDPTQPPRPTRFRPVCMPLPAIVVLLSNRVQQLLVVILP